MNPRASYDKRGADDLTWRYFGTVVKQLLLCIVMYGWICTALYSRAIHGDLVLKCLLTLLKARAEAVNVSFSWRVSPGAHWGASSRCNNGTYVFLIDLKQIVAWLTLLAYIPALEKRLNVCLKDAYFVKRMPCYDSFKLWLCEWCKTNQWPCVLEMVFWFVSAVERYSISRLTTNIGCKWWNSPWLILLTRTVLHSTILQ